MKQALPILSNPRGAIVVAVSELAPPAILRGAAGTETFLERHWRFGGGVFGGGVLGGGVLGFGGGVVGPSTGRLTTEKVTGIAARVKKFLLPDRRRLHSDI